ncbi:MAG: TauD/TfdA family dioxygenase [Caulobacterales bacterium]|nr:TauD/TfdA family dioxygenase [Caulobacterales bacterium]
MLDTALRIQPTAGCGANVSDVDLARLTDAEVAQLRQALFDHGALFFRGQSLTPEQHIALAERIAPIDVNRFFPAAPGYPVIAKVEKTAEQTTNIGGGWHTDHSYDLEPAMGSVLVARDLPPSGGDTLFADMYAAYDTLDAGTKAQIAGLRAVHGSDHVFGEKGVYAQTDQPELARGGVETPETVHPVVIRHPGSGKPVLYVNPSFTLRFEGQTREESLPLLMKLYAHAMNMDRVHTLVWEPGMVAIWDNRATWHFAKNDYHGRYRLMHRITLAGCPLEAA